jgi:hypothetical protein
MTRHASQVAPVCIHHVGPIEVVRHGELLAVGRPDRRAADPDGHAGAKRRPCGEQFPVGRDELDSVGCTECDSLAIRRPCGCGSVLHQQSALRPVAATDVERRLAVAARHERDPAPVRRPGGCVVAPCGFRVQNALAASIRVDQGDRSVGDVGKPSAVGRPVDVTPVVLVVLTRLHEQPVAARSKVHDVKAVVASRATERGDAESQLPAVG